MTKANCRRVAPRTIKPSGLKDVFAAQKNHILISFPGKCECVAAAYL